MEFLRLLLLPLAIFYELITRLRNILFNFKILPSSSYKLPVISVGNLSAGGTGKTPHVEYLIRLLTPSYRIATLSRGYGRKTSGFRLAGNNDHSGTIGDEPAQFHKKFPEILVVADESRRHGIKSLLQSHPETDLIILDDAFQHRYVKPGLSVLLTDYHKLFTNDYLLPFGTLREARKGSQRANVIVVTKTPVVLSPFERNRIIESIKPSPFQKILFSFIKYGEIQSLWNDSEIIDKSAKYSVIMLIAGIANPYPLEYELRSRCSDLIIMRFKDHHKYSSNDLRVIKENYSDIYTRNKLLVTTEKDAMRMLDPEVKEQASQLPFYYIPMEIDFHEKDKQIFDETIIKYVKENKRER
ncbi:MAG: tetraacyldisaccharide 4'-kinase [Chloroflexota bacterium]|nr:tetraacyldisaccharide 4'-kinase [Lentimicrobium sp.]